MSSVYRSHMITSANGEPLRPEAEAIARCVMLLEACRMFVHHATAVCAEGADEECKKKLEDECIQFGTNVSEIVKYHRAQTDEDVRFVAEQLGVKIRPMASGAGSHLN